MSLRQRLGRWLLGEDSYTEDLDEEIRVVQPASQKENRTTVDDDVSSSFKEANLQDIIRFLDKLKVQSNTKKELYAIYDKMEEDSIIAGALEILTDDVVHRDSMRGERVWAEPAEGSGKIGQEAANCVNEFLAAIDMNTKVWAYAYNVIKYGELYLKTFNQDFIDGKIDEQFKEYNGLLYEKVDNPSDIETLEKYGEVVGYGVKSRSSRDDSETMGYNLVSKDEYVHYISDKKMIRKSIHLKYATDENGEEIYDDFKTVIGSSYLEPARQAWTIIDLIETLLLYVRFQKSDVFKVVSVEVGTAGRTESTKILRNIKRMMNNQDSMNANTKTYTGYKKPIPHNDFIYIATKQGKGEINIQEYGGNVDIKEIVDLDYWLDKLVAALRQPRAYLGLADDNLTGLNNQSLTRQDIRYSRTVQAFKEVVIHGVKNQCDYYLEVTGHGDYLDKYEIMGARVLSAETTDKMEDIAGRIELATTINEFLQQIEGIDQSEAIRIIVEKVLDIADIDPDLLELINNRDLSAKGNVSSEEDNE